MEDAAASSRFRSVIYILVFWLPAGLVPSSTCGARLSAWRKLPPFRWEASAPSRGDDFRVVASPLPVVGTILST